MFSVGILTISDKGSRGEREDLSGPEIRRIISELPARIEAYEVIPDEEDIIIQKLVDYVDRKKVDLLLTTGGTGLSPRDVTPEATRKVLHKEIPGIAEAMRAEGMKITSLAMLSRAVSGVRCRTLIINLPGSPQAVLENLTVIFPALKHALEKIQGDPSDCAPQTIPSPPNKEGTSINSPA
ncbi:MAG: MogA/MoaB family molybdenum cofactor biosynthesis protein [Thermodesulfobacteriota bacterium]|nr:MogA/MoaB family molybdenum cofactor biosynthesis protein [Thermodesulfobacteriota bacterium]